jgi:hypothetical protein
LVAALAARDDFQIIAQQTVDVPSGFDTLVEVGIDAAAAGENLSGFVTAFGGRGHRCFAYVFKTTAGGPGREQVVGERLGVMVERSLLLTKLHSELVPEIPRDPWLAR